MSACIELDSLTSVLEFGTGEFDDCPSTRKVRGQRRSLGGCPVVLTGLVVQHWNSAHSLCHVGRL